MRSRYTGRELSAVVKSDAYGLGLEAIVPVLADAGCRSFWVNDLGEALRLKAVLPSAVLRETTVYTLFGLGGATPGDFEQAAVVPVLASLDEVWQCGGHARRSGRRMAVAIQLDTGLGRLGLTADDVDRLGGDHLAPLDIRCWVTHLAAFDCPDDPMNDRQRRMLLDLTARLPQAPVSLASSSGVFMGPDWHFDIARIGSALYGVQTSSRWQEGLVPCYRLLAPVLRVADMPAGARVGYRGTTALTRPSRIATLALGYGDGLPQGFVTAGLAFLSGEALPFVGGMAMNLTMVDVTDLLDGAVGPGTQMEILGPRQTIDSLADALGCAPNVLLTQVGAGCAHRYLGTGG